MLPPLCCWPATNLQPHRNQHEPCVSGWAVCVENPMVFKCILYILEQTGLVFCSHHSLYTDFPLCHDYEKTSDYRGNQIIEVLLKNKYTDVPLCYVV